MKPDSRTAYLLLCSCLVPLLTLTQPVSAQEKPAADTALSQAPPTETAAGEAPSAAAAAAVEPYASGKGRGGSRLAQAATACSGALQFQGSRSLIRLAG